MCISGKFVFLIRQTFRQTQVERLEVLSIVKHSFWNLSFAIKDGPEFNASVFAGESHLNEVVDGHQALLAINDKEAIPRLFVEKQLGHRQAQDERLNKF